MKWNYVIMNPPYAYKENNCLDINFVNKTMELCDKVIAIFPNYLINRNGPYLKFFKSKHLNELELKYVRDIFDIATVWKYVGIYNIDTTNTYDKFTIISPDNTSEELNNDFEDRKDYTDKLYWGNLYKFAKETKTLYEKLMKENKSLCHDHDDYIYEENKGGLYGIKKPGQKKLERVKKYLNDGTYKYCIYKGSGNNSYDKPQEWLGQDPDKLFKGQICWLTNKENVKNNIKYWLKSPLCDAWRLYYFNNAKLAACWAYFKIPALPFDKSENDFKEYVDSLNEFTKEQIDILKEFNIHNADKLKQKK